MAELYHEFFSKDKISISSHPGHMTLSDVTYMCIWFFQQLISSLDLTIWRIATAVTLLSSGQLIRLSHYTVSGDSIPC